MKKLLIIDGNAILHRAYHALPPLTNSQGEPVHAVYGFFSMLLKVLKELEPEYLLVCFDRPAPTFRKLLYAGYQAHRPQMTSDLSGQIDLLHRALKEVGIVVSEIDGYEADDIIGTAAHGMSLSNTIETFILSGDRDLLQLVSPNVYVFMPIVGITKFVIYNEEKVKEIFGIFPYQFVDYKALIGDASDGYPGVAGIGPKTATGLLHKYETFENIYTNLSFIPPRVAEKLALDAEQAALAKKLATIVKDVPITLPLQTLRLTQNHFVTIEKVLEKLNFSSLTKRIPHYSLEAIEQEQLVLI